MVAGSILLAIIIFITVSYFLQFSFYYNMQLIQFNVYLDQHVHIFMLSYIFVSVKFALIRKCE